MKKKLTKQMLLGVLAAAIMGISANNAEAQTFTNTGAGTYKADCGAIIRLKAAGTAAEIKSTGTVPIGTATSAIPGVVEYTRSDASAQTVKPYYYNQLVLSGSNAKTVPDGIFVMGTQCSSYLAGYSKLADYPYYVAVGSGTVTYSDGGTFNYAGVTTQNIFPDSYQTISVAGAGDAVIPALSSVVGSEVGPVTAENITSATDAPIVINGTLNLTTGVSDINGTLNLADAGILTTGAGNVTIDGAVTSQGDITTGGGTVAFSSDIALSGNATLTTGSGNVTIANDGTTTHGTLALTNTAAVTTGTGNVTVQGPTTTADNTTITVAAAGGLTFTNTLGLAGDLFVADGTEAAPLGTLTIATTGAATIATTGNLDLGSYSNMIIAGTIANEGVGTNLIFDCTSTANYTAGVQTIMPTIATNPYGNLTLSGVGLKQSGNVPTYPSGEQSNISVCKNFSLAGGNLDMYKGGTNPGSLVMKDATLNPTYAAQFEVVGRMQRNWTTGNTAYTFNNTKTTVVLTGGTAAGGTATDYFAMDVRPGVNPRQFNAETDVNRKIVMDYTSGFIGWSANVQVGYLPNTEKPSFTGTGAGLSIADLKYFEADDGGIEKLGGTGYGTPNTTDPMSHMSMAGILPGTAPVDNIIEREFTSGHDLVLRANNTMYNIANGRWTNPNSWDEGRVPTAADNVELRYSVYVGIDGGFIGTTGGASDDTPTENTKSEYNHYGNTDVAAAKRIIIANKLAAAGSPNPALIIGNEDNPDGYIFRTAVGGVIDNQNATTASLPWPIAPGTLKSTVNIGDIQGIWVTPFVIGTKVPGIGAAAITNVGTVNNQGVIEVGE